MTRPSYRYEAYLRCSPDRAWEAITDPQLTANYYYGTLVESDWEVGSAIRYFSKDGKLVADGEILSIDTPHRVEMTFVVRWDPDLEQEGPTRMAWVVEEVDGTSLVAVEYYDLAPETGRAADFAQGIPWIVSGMKTLIETGQALDASR